MESIITTGQDVKLADLPVYIFGTWLDVMAHCYPCLIQILYNLSQPPATINTFFA